VINAETNNENSEIWPKTESELFNTPAIKLSNKTMAGRAIRRFITKYSAKAQEVAVTESAPTRLLIEAPNQATEVRTNKQAMTTKMSLKPVSS
jgi:hypothetical protein